jgi:hypothetical protein
LINTERIRQIEPVKSSQVNFTRIHFADFATTLDVYEKYEEVKMILSQARPVLQPRSGLGIRLKRRTSQTSEPLSPSPAKWNT